MELRVLFFASLREKLRRSELTCSAPDGTTVQGLLDRLAAEHAPVAAMRAALSVAVNQEYVEPGHQLRDGDEVALIPPVSGGCDV
jgi:molybdopterin synthase catalytic subunit